TINTSQTPAIAYVGQALSDTATVTGLVSPSTSDTVTFNLYSSATTQNTTTLHTTKIQTRTNSVGTATATTIPYPAAAPGTVYWVASFTAASSHPLVSHSSPTRRSSDLTINTSQTPAIAYVGQALSDTATVTGLVSPSSGDTVTFNLYSSATTQN